MLTSGKLGEGYMTALYSIFPIAFFCKSKTMPKLKVSLKNGRQISIY